MQRRPTFTIAVVDELLEHAARSGADVEPLRRRLGLGHAPPQLDARVPATLVLRLWDELPQLCAAPDFGLGFAASIAKPTANLATLLVTSAGTLGEGIARFLANEEAFNSLLPTRIEHEGAEARIVLDPAEVALDRPVSHHAVEAVLAWWWLMIGHSVSGPVVARRVELVHAGPKDPTAHRNVFGVDPRFGRARNLLALPAEVLHRPLSTRSPRLRQVAEQAAEQLLRTTPALEDDPVASVREEIVRALERGTTPSQAATAKALGVSARTLQRALGACGATFTAVVDEARGAEARRLLLHTRLSMQDVARRLGYYDTAGFFRAFRRWTGTTPGEFRRRGSDLP